MSATPVQREAAEFVAEAERMTNERDVDGVRDVYAPDAHWTTVLDGTVIESHGIDEIHRDWGLLCAVMDRRGMFVRKHVVAADGNTIVNEWAGTVGGRSGPRGIEVWVRDDAGRVIKQHLYAFGDARPDSSAVQQLRMLIAHPLTAWAHARARMRRSA